MSKAEKKSCPPRRRSGLALEFLERTFRQGIHRGWQRDHDRGKRRLDERRGDGRDVDEDGDEVLRASECNTGGPGHEPAALDLELGRAASDERSERIDRRRDLRSWQKLACF
jgi:hypothetical protein